MEDVKVGRLFRALRIHRGWRQVDLADRVGVSRSLISLIERGHLSATTLATLRLVASQLEASLDVNPRWRGGEADRLLNAGHVRLHEAIARYLDALDGWVHVPEIAFSIYGERGVIDILAFHEPTRCVLVVELKTELTDLEQLLTVMSRRSRLARTIAGERGWEAESVSSWVVVAENDADRRRVRRHAATIRSALPADGRAMRTWLRRRSGSIAALSFWANVTGRSTTRESDSRRRVRATKKAA